MGAGGAGRGQAQQPADPALGRLCRLPLVPRDGARVVRGRADRARDERAVRQHQGRPRGAAGHRPDLHERAASAGRAGRLAADHVSDAQGRAGVGRHVFPEGVELRPAGLRRHAARGVAHVPRGAGQDRAEPRGAAGAAGRQSAAGRQGDHRAEGARRRRPPDRQRLRSGAWRPARRAEVSAAGDHGNALARGLAHRRCAVLRHGRAFARAHERGRHLRSSRRRLFALFGRRTLAGAAFREDAVRQCAAPGTAGARLSAQRQSAVRDSARARRSTGSSAR